MQATLTRERAQPTDRSTDRRVALWSIAGSIAFLAAAAVSLLLPADVRHGLWLPIHLALAGGATTAIVGVMPFFVAAFAAAQPADPRLRVVSLVAVGFGAVAVSVSVVTGASGIAVLGGVSFITGLALTGIASLQPLRRALGPSRGLVARAYLVALVYVAIGATVATLFLAGWPPVAESWQRLKPAHAWLNVVGFVSLVIATTLMHFFPTTVGARIGSHWSGRVTILGIAAGGILVPVGYATGLDIVAQAGAAATLLGAIALAIYVSERWRGRARWSTDLAWHRFVIGGLISAVAWFVVGVAIASVRVLVAGANPSGWASETIAAPLVVGWVAVAVVASTSHLLPAVGPGDQAAHAQQRVILGRGATWRLVAIDAGIAALLVGGALGLSALAIGGAVLTAGCFAVTTVLIAMAISVGLRATRVDRVESL